MGNMRIPSCFSNWIRNFLSDRRGRVLWQGATSKPRIFSQGLPQGSVLAPTLWNIFMDDLLRGMPPNVLQLAYADDTTCGAQATTIEKCEAILQPAASWIYDWCRKWKVLLSTTKSVLSFHSLAPSETNGKAVPKVYFGADLIPYDPTPRLLGIHIDCQLTFRYQATHVNSRLRSRLKVLRYLTGRDGM